MEYVAVSGGRPMEKALCLQQPMFGACGETPASGSRKATATEQFGSDRGDGSGHGCWRRRSSGYSLETGEEAFMAEVGAQFGRQWKRGRPRKDELQKTGITITAKERVQLTLF